MSSPAPPSERATVRHKGRGHDDRELVHSILDEATLCHLGVVQADGSPMVLPTLFARLDLPDAAGVIPVTVVRGELV